MHWRRRLVNGLTARVVGMGGAAVIVAIALIFVYLLWVVLPLFQPASVAPRLDVAATNHRAVLLDVNDNSEVGLELTAEGTFKFVALVDGTELASLRATEEPVLGALELQPV